MTPAVQRAALRASTEAQARAKRENAKHTPGPWTKADRLNGPWWHISSDHTIGGNRCLSGKQAIACVHGESKKGSAAYAEMFEANARLIAAAPELLDALDGLAAQVRPLWAELDIDGFRHSALKEAYDFACKVAGKAQGEPQ